MRFCQPRLPMAFAKECRRHLLCDFVPLAVFILLAFSSSSISAEETDKSPTTLKFSLPVPFDGGESTVSFSASEGNTYKGQFETSLQLAEQDVAVILSATMVISTNNVTTLELSGSTAGPFTIPGTGFTFQEFKLNGSVTLGGSTTINYLNLKGGADLAGIGEANGTFAYEDLNLAFSLEMAPKLPAPFEEDGTSISLAGSFENGNMELEGAFSSYLVLAPNSDPVRVSGTATFSSVAQVSSLKLTGATSSSFTIPGTGFTFKEFQLNGSVTLGGSTTINYLNLKGGADLAGIGEANGTFAYDANSGMALSLKVSLPDLPQPFGPTNIDMNVDVSSEGSSRLQGDFSALIRLSGVQDPVNVLTTAVITTVDNKTAVSFNGGAVGTISVTGLSCLSFSGLALSADFTLNPVVTKSLTLQGTVDMCGQVANGIFAFDQNGASELVILWSPKLPAPFTGDPLINLTLSVDPQSSEYQLTGSFETTLALDNVDPVDVNVLASVVSSGGDVSLHFGGTTSSNINVPDLPCLVINPMDLSAYFILSPFKVSSLSLTGGASVCDLGSAKAVFTYDSSLNSTYFSMEIRPNLPPPLSSDSTANFTLVMKGEDLGFQATFTSGIALPDLDSPLGFKLNVFVSVTPANTTMALSGKSISSVKFSSYPAFSILSLGVVGLITITPSSTTLNSLTLTGALSVADYTANGTFLYDPASNATGLLMTVPYLDMQALLDEMNTKVYLGDLGLTLSDVNASYATAAIPALAIPRGMQFAATISVLNMFATSSFELVTTPKTNVSFKIEFDAASMQKGLDFVVTEVKDTLNSALSNLTVLGRRRHHHRRSLLAQHQYLDGSGILPAAAADGDSDSFGVEGSRGSTVFFNDSTTESTDLATTRHRRNLHGVWAVATYIQTMNEVINIVNSGFKFKSFGLAFSFVSGARARIDITYSLVMNGGIGNGDGKLTYTFPKKPAATTTTGRHLLQNQKESLKDKIVRKVLDTVIKKIKKKYPSIAPFLPKSSSCGESGSPCDTVCECGACGRTCNDIQGWKIIPDSMPNIEFSDGSKLFDNDKITGALSSMCEAVFPSYSQAQIVSKALSSSFYAKQFAPACYQFADALSMQEPSTYYLVLGLPIGPYDFLLGAKVCFALRPNCGSNKDLQILSGISGVSITIPAAPPIIVTPQYLVFSSIGNLTTNSSSKMWSMDVAAKTLGSLAEVSMLSHISLRGSIGVGLEFSTYLRVELSCQITFGVNLDTRGDGFDGADFGFIMDASLAPVIILNKPDGTNLFKFGGQDSGLEATATLYFWSQGPPSTIALKAGMTSTLDFTKLIRSVMVNGKPLSDATSTSASGMLNIQASISFMIDIPGGSLWGAYLSGTYSVDFGLPATVTDMISSLGWGEAIYNIPYIGDVFKNGIRLSISGGVIVQTDQYKSDMVHLGFANKGSVTWLDFLTCQRDSDCFSNQCCLYSLVCVSNTVEVLGIPVCNAVTKAITDGINFVTDAMVSIGKVIGSTLDKLYDAAIQGVFKFYRYVIPNDPKRSTSQYDAFNFWRGDSIMDAGTDFFIRVDTKEWTKFSVGIGISLPDTEPAWPTFMECRGKNSDENAAWWYIRDGGQGNSSHLVFENKETIKKNGSNTYCLDVRRANFTEGEPLVLYRCNKTPAQKFVLSPFGTDPYWMYIQPMAAPWLCLELEPRRDSPLKLAICQPNNNRQRFGLSTKNWYGGKVQGNG